MMLNKPCWDKHNLKYKKADVSIDGRHIYTKNSDGTKLTGTTSIISNASKDFMAPWAVKEMYEYIKKNFDYKHKYTEKELDELLLAGRKQYSLKSAVARKNGTEVHQWVSDHIQGKESKKPSNAEVQNSVNSFLQFEKEHKIEWLLSEEVVASIKKYKEKGKEVYLNIAGTLDALAYIDGVLSLIDFKTSSQMPVNAYLQLAAYWFMLKEQMGIEAEQRLIIRIPKDKSEVETAVVNTPLDFDIATFMNLRQLHRWRVNLRNNYSERVNGFLKLKIKHLTK